MDIEILYVSDCPHLDAATARLGEALRVTGVDATIRRTAVDTDEGARALGMRGSPTILIDGRDPFAATADPSLSCRLFRTGDGYDAAPSTDQLVAALTS